MDNVKAGIVSILVAVITGIGSSYVSVKIMETKFVYVDRDIASILSAINVAVDNKAELKARHVWMDNTDRRLNILESKQ